MKTERELFEEWHYGQYLLENPDVDLANAKYIYDYAHKNALVYQMRETCFIVWQASAQREGYKLVPLQPSNNTIVVIERKVENQLEASGIDADPFRLDGEKIYKAMIGASE